MSDQLELIPQPPKLSTCRTCRAPIIWVRTERGKKMPLDAKPVEDQTQASLFVLRDIHSYEGPLAIAAWGLVGLEPHYMSHFATCEQNQAQQPPQDPGRRYAGRKYRTTKR
jgi:hypothetical protein